MHDDEVFAFGFGFFLAAILMFVIAALCAAPTPAELEVLARGTYPYLNFTKVDSDTLFAINPTTGECFAIAAVDGPFSYHALAKQIDCPAR